LTSDHVLRPCSSLNVSSRILVVEAFPPIEIRELNSSS
jgi:hypothetical protein